MKHLISFGAFVLIVYTLSTILPATFASGVFSVIIANIACGIVAIYTDKK